MHLGMTHMNIFGHHVCINLSGHHFCLNIFEHNVYMNIFGHNICLHEYIWKPCLHEYFWTPCRLGFLRNVIFLCYFTQKYFFICARSGKTFAQYSALFRITRNKICAYLRNLRKNQNCEKKFAQIAKLPKKQHFAQKLNPCVKIKV